MHLRDRLFRLAALALAFAPVAAGASEFNRAWKNPDRALVLDGYQHNEFDLTKIVTDKRIAAFIHKASDGIAPPYRCKGGEVETDLCRVKWQKYIVGRELYHSRRHLAKALGLKWGAYHLARPGNPYAQAMHFLSYAKPTEDEVMIIDLEGLDDKWMSLEDTETFARIIHAETGRWPMLYTNGMAATAIAEQREQFPILSRLPLWYARYKPSIDGHFPKGHWQSYDIWQFLAQVNCSKSRCAYRVPGTNRDIDVNVVDMDVEALKAAWPFDELVPETAPQAEMLIAEAEEALIDAMHETGDLPFVDAMRSSTFKVPLINDLY